MASKTDSDNAKSKVGFGLDADDSPVADAGSKKKAKPKVTPKHTAKVAKATKKAQKAKRQRPDPTSVIPKVVSNRMIRRVGIFSGLPTLLAFLTIPTSYFVTEQGWIDFPSTVVLMTSVSFLGLGLVGVSYGIVSASWDEDIKGSWLGMSEFKLNLGRIQERRRIQKEQRKRLKADAAKADSKSAPSDLADSNAATTNPESPSDLEPQEQSADL
ncbi:MAG: DUF3464 family protein [Acaryochloridaceae cyanobacterium CSU_3_4]|nr:DUF3464 family protein [Acaryochloridaceae cyanobacterium CSU_3_4]